MPQAPRTLRSALLATAALALPAAASAQADELNALVWCDHTDPEFLRPFEDEHGVRVNVRDYEGTGTALSLIEQSRPGDWDVFVIDGIDVPRAVEAGILDPLPEGELPTGEIFEGAKLEEQQVIDGQRYAVTEKFGYNTISFNKAEVDPAAMNDMAVIWSDAYAGNMAVYDYYLPVIGMVAVGLGLDTLALTEGDLPAIREKLFAMKDAAALVGEVVQSQTALATGEVDVLVGGGEWVTAGLSEENPNLDWVLPEQGGVMWSQSIGIFADSERKDLALEFVKYVLSAEGQARLATSSCYWAMPANREAGEHLSDEQKRALRWDDQEAYLANAQPYPAPDAELDRAMQDLWTEFLQR